MKERLRSKRPQSHTKGVNADVYGKWSTNTKKKETPQGNGKRAERGAHFAALEVRAGWKGEVLAPLICSAEHMNDGEMYFGGSSVAYAVHEGKGAECS